MTMPDWDYAHTADARVRRVEKAERLAVAIGWLGHVPSEEERRQLLRDASVKSASDETWSMAIEIYRERKA